jgi:acyl-CoA synthetase (AMP-forming)/AMP-acid ligase II
VAIFGVPDPAAGLDTVVLVAEVAPGAGPLPSVAAGLKRALLDGLELLVSRVEFVAAGGLPVTTSGKVRVSRARELFLAGALPLLDRRAGRVPG